MRVATGYSEEVSSCNWIKGEVELDSTDLEDLAVQHGFNTAGLTLVQKYGILSSEAEMLLTSEYYMAVQSRAPGTRDMNALLKRLELAKQRAQASIDLAKRVSHGGVGEETS
jgi:hypothetical protein